MCWKFFVMRYGLHVHFHLIQINSLTHPFLNLCWLKSFNLINQTFGVFIDNIVVMYQIKEVIPSFPTSIEEIHRSKNLCICRVRLNLSNYNQVSIKITGKILWEDF